jgi:tetratricopeptide (TPR) repeat protein
MTADDDLDEALADARALLDAELKTWCPSPDLHERELEVDRELARVNADARLLLDVLLDRRPVVRRRRPRTLAAAAAAVVLFGLAGAAFASKKWQELEAAAESERFAAEAIAELDRTWLAESERSTSIADRLPDHIIPVVSVPARPVGPPVPEPASDQTEVPPELDTGDRLAELDAQAYALLRAGQHEQAVRKFRLIVKIGGSSEYAELAYGELFALARREGDDELDELWQAYLKRFPRGRYADAARAGLCRRISEPNDRACWTEYLLEHPHGAARSEALRATQDP